MKFSILTRTLAAAALAAAAALPVAAITEADNGFGATVSAGVPGTLFGPVTYERTQGPPDQYNDTFNAPFAGNFVLRVKNGDTNADGDPEQRVSSASILLNGAEVVSPNEFNQQVDAVEKTVALNSGANTISVQINGMPGAYITVAITGMPMPHTHGRLLTPWVTTGNGSVRFALKNGSHEFRRAVRAVFFNPDGTVACRSPRMLLNPHGALETGLATLLNGCPFMGGSVEFFWSGHGPARVFGTVTFQNMTGEISALQLHGAGYHGHRPPPNSALPGPQFDTNPVIRKTPLR